MRKDAIRDPNLLPTGPVLMDSAVWVCGVVCGVGMQGNRSPSSLQRFPSSGVCCSESSPGVSGLEPCQPAPKTYSSSP